MVLTTEGAVADVEKDDPAAAMAGMGGMGGMGGMM
jgi:chaperonin GroEL